MADAVRNLDIITRLKGATESKAGFDGMSVSAKDLQTRIQDLDLRMNKLTTSLGKHAYESKAGIIITRERKLALEQLLAIEEKEQAVTQRSVRGLGSLSSAALAASGSISGLGTGMSVLTNALMSGVGLTAGLAAAVAGFSLLMEIIRDTNTEMDKFKNQISGMLDVAGPGGNFKVDPKQLDSMIATLQTKIDAYRNAKTTSEGTKGSFEFQNIKFQEALVEVLNEANIAYKEQQSIIDGLIQEGYTFTEKEKEKTKVIKEQTKSLEELSHPLQMLMKLYKQQNEQELPAGMGGLPSRFNMNMVSVPSQPAITFTKEQMEEQYGLYADLFRDAADVMRSEFGSAWESIFGDANSLFEKLIASWASTLFTKLGNSFGGAILDLLPGGGAIADLLGLSKAVNIGNNYATKLRLE